MADEERHLLQRTRFLRTAKRILTISARGLLVTDVASDAPKGAFAFKDMLAFAPSRWGPLPPPLSLPAPRTPLRAVARVPLTLLLAARRCCSPFAAAACRSPLLLAAARGRMLALDRAAPGLRLSSPSRSRGHPPTRTPPPTGCTCSCRTRGFVSWARVHQCPCSMQRS